MSSWALLQRKHHGSKRRNLTHRRLMGLHFRASFERTVTTCSPVSGMSIVPASDSVNFSQAPVEGGRTSMVRSPSAITSRASWSTAAHEAVTLYLPGAPSLTFHEAES